MLREHFGHIINRLKNFGEARKYLRLINNNTKYNDKEDKIELRIGYSSFLIQLGKYKQAAEQIAIVKASNYDGYRKKEFLDNEQFLEKGGILQNKTKQYATKGVVSGVVAASFLFFCAYNVFAEEPAESSSLVEKIAGVREAQAALPTLQPTLQLPAPGMPKQIPQATIFLSYINAPPAKREPTEEDFREMKVYEPYYFVDDNKKKLEDKMMEPINKSEFKERRNIDKISTKLDQDKIRFKVRFKEYEKREKVFTIEAKPQDSYYEAKFSLRF